MSMHTSETLLREAGLRVTKPRLAVLEVLGARPHADTGAVLDGVRRELPAVSHQAVYDCLAAMTDAEYYSAESATELIEVFRSLPTHLITKSETTEISVAFVALGALLAALALSRLKSLMYSLASGSAARAALKAMETNSSPSTSEKTDLRSEPSCSNISLTTSQASTRPA